MPASASSRPGAQAKAAMERLPAGAQRGPGRDPRFDLPEWQVTINGIRTAFFDAGQGDAVLFLHCLAGNATHWLHVAPAFAATHRVVGLDLPGHGASDRPDTVYTIRGYAEHVRVLMDELGIQRATLVGHAMGAMVATELAVLHPERVRSVALINPSGFQPAPRVVRTLARTLLGRRVLNVLFPRTWRLILHAVFWEKNDRTRAFVQNVAATYSPEDVFAMTRVMLALRPDLLDRSFARVLGDLAMPTHVLYGERDVLVPARFLRRTAAQRQGMIVRALAGCGHMPIVERPDEVCAFLRETLR